MKYDIFNCDCLDLLNSDVLNQSGKKLIVVTDPPFNIGYHYNTYKDRMKEEDYMNLLSRILTGGKPFVVVHYPESLHRLSVYLGMVPERVVSWVYNSNTAKQHRDIAFYGIKPDFSQVRQPYKNINDKRIQERIAKGCTGAKLYDWWNINQIKNISKEKTKHPCQMPVQVMKNIVGLLPKDCIVFDPFMGSGTTGVACAELGIDFIGCEIDKTYFDIAAERLNAYEF